MTRGGRIALIIGIIILMALVGVWIYNRSHSKNVNTFTVVLSGENELGPDGKRGAGDLKAQGISARVKINAQSGQVDWQFRGLSENNPQGYPPVSGAHIHAGNITQNGPPVIDFNSQPRGSITLNNAALLNEILSAPMNYYVNLHTSAYPDGAVRGQLQVLQ